MTSKKWCITFAISILLVIFMYALFNYIVDPFGVFGDKLFNWYSYNMTNNPRVAKIAYLDKDENYKKYDSYVIGCSSTSSFSVEDLNNYFGGSYYNMIMYGADMLDVEQTCKYVIEQYKAKNILINIFLSNATKYNIEEDNITKNMHEKLNGESKISFYSRYLFLDPQYSMAKIKAKGEDTYLTQTFDVFVEETGVYDKKVRDAEPISSLTEYYKNYPVFENYPMESLEMTEIDTTVESIKRIKEMCEENNVNVTFVMAPAYYEYVKYFSEESVKKFQRKIAQVTDYWDFTLSSLCKEPRFFYDETHFRNCMGKMAIAKMAGATDTYYPEDIGEYVTKENIEEHLEKEFALLNEFETEKNDYESLGTVEKEENKSELVGSVGTEGNNVELLSSVRVTEKDYVKQVPILTYHSIVENPTSNSEISPQTFESQMKAISEAGYNTITFEDLVSYVEKGTELPEKPICITFDDGYMNNYEIAFPILKKYQMKATIFVIGVSVGATTNYKDTDYPITPHFTYAQAKEMIDSNLISIQSHTYDMHQWAPYENEQSGSDETATNGSKKIRENILKLESETESEYIEALKQDLLKMQEEIDKNLNKTESSLAKENNTSTTSNFKLDTTTNDEAQNANIAISNSDLNETTSNKNENSIIALSYPSGKWDTLSSVVLRENGIKVTVTIEEGMNEIVKGLPQSLYSLKRYNVDETVQADELIRKLEIEMEGYLKK